MRVPFLHLSPRLQAWIAFHIVSVITVGLWLDANFGWTGQHIATIWAFTVWAWLYWLGGRVERFTLIFATVLSGLGEVFLSLVWGVYDYQFHNVPLFVPPGHALLMTLGLLIAARIPPPLVKVFVGLVTLTALCWGISVWVLNTDRFGAALFVLYLGCVIFGAQRTLYATMFILALIMELYGTALGNWFWLSPTPWVALSAANPPFSAGAFYCALDLLVLAMLRATISNSTIGGHFRAIMPDDTRQ